MKSAARANPTPIQLMSGYGALVNNLYERGRAYAHNRYSYQVTIESKDRLYRPAQVWILQQIAHADQRALLVSSGNTNELSGSSDPEPVRRMQVAYDADITTSFKVGPHRVTAQITRPDPTDWDRHPTTRLTMRCWSVAARDLLVRHLRTLASQDDRPPTLHIATQWGNWVERAERYTRPLDTVVLAAGQRERIEADLRRFLLAERNYALRGLPYHRGYLLHGPPGTGKTSLARALAGHFGLELWYLPLGDLKSDAGLLERLAHVRPKSMLLLEDIDVFAASQSRDATEGLLSLSGLLNGLDGVATPHGLVTVMTSNDKSKLDAAVYRPGRIDLIESIERLNVEQMGLLFQQMRGRAPNLGEQCDIEQAWQSGASPAAVIAEWNRSLDNQANHVVRFGSNESSYHGYST